MKKLGYTVGKHLDLYGEKMELVSDPFDEGELVSVHAVSAKNPTVRKVALPVSILSGREGLFLQPSDSSDSIAREPGATRGRARPSYR
jgi:hypothetical protein